MKHESKWCETRMKNNITTHFSLFLRKKNWSVYFCFLILHVSMPSGFQVYVDINPFLLYSPYYSTPSISFPFVTFPSLLKNGITSDSISISFLTYSIPNSYLSSPSWNNCHVIFYIYILGSRLSSLHIAIFKKKLLKFIF